jgi:alpha-N-arabinofuranosidase
LGITTLRWPGGLFASGYHWADGIGPRDARPRRVDLAWRSEESNRFGTDEFIRYCRRIGVEPVICINMGSGSIDEAQSWVEYCNGHGDTFWANMRRRNGADTAHAVRYWSLGNEVYNRFAIGTLAAEDYVKKAIEIAKVMRMTDPTIKLISSGLNGWSRWDRTVLEGVGPYVDLHSVHLYTGSADYYSNVFAPHLAERAVRACQGTIEGVRYQQGIRHPIHIAFDEWNVWYRAGSPIMTSDAGIVRQAIYHPLCLYSRLMRGDSVDAFVDCERITLRPEDETAPWPHRVADLGPFTVLDASAVLSPDGSSVRLAVINRDRSRDVHAAVEIAGATVPADGVAYQMNATSVESANSFDRPGDVGVLERPIRVTDQPFMYLFPAHSLTMLSLDVDDVRQGPSDSRHLV